MLVDRPWFLAYVIGAAALAFVLYDGKAQAKCEQTNSHDVCFQQLNR